MSRPTRIDVLVNLLRGCTRETPRTTDRMLGEAKIRQLDIQSNRHMRAFHEYEGSHT